MEIGSMAALGHIPGRHSQELCGGEFLATVRYPDVCLQQLVPDWTWLYTVNRDVREGISGRENTISKAVLLENNTGSLQPICG
jgi:hypothetical protein